MDTPTSDVSRKIGELFVASGDITERQLEEAIAYQRQTHGRIGWVLITLGCINRLRFFTLLASHYQLDFRSDIESVPREIDYALLAMIEPGEIIECQSLPYKLEGETLVVLTALPGNEAVVLFLKQRFHVKALRPIVITDLDLTKITEFLYRDTLLENSTYGLFFIKPQNSAYSVFIRRQVGAFGVFFMGLLSWAYMGFSSLLLALNMAVQLFYVLISAFKLIVSLVGIRRMDESQTSEGNAIAVNDTELPVYSILVPVYKEPEVIGKLMEGLKKIDYPQNKLDILLLLEEDDHATLAAARAQNPPGNWRFLIVPDSLPKTKPKACNYGLAFARGKYLVIYDAEDIPDRDQLKKAVAAFQKGGPRYVCYQGALNYFNKEENLLTRLFTLEYSHWFDYLLPGLERLGGVIPLGGTSNHFDTEALKRLGGWDPFNTTEDADLGIRAYVEGYRVGTLDATTYEEANARVGSFIKQRSRWIKGYMQTWIVYSRHPLRLMRSIGLRGWLSFNLLIGGTSFAALVNPITWCIFLLWGVTETTAFEGAFPPAMLYIALFNFFFGNFLGIYLNMFAVFKRRAYSLLPFAFLTPFYAILHSLAAYKALFQLFSQPFYWEKTQHGITKQKEMLSVPVTGNS